MLWFKLSIWFSELSALASYTNMISIAQCKTAVSPMLTHWRYYSLALSHRYIQLQHGEVITSYISLWMQSHFHAMLSAVVNKHLSWRRQQMKTFSVLLAICAGNSPVPGELPAQRPVTRSFGVFFDLRPNKRLSKQWWGWWFETPLSPLWRHCNALKLCHGLVITVHDFTWMPLLKHLKFSVGATQLCTYFPAIYHYRCGFCLTESDRSSVSSLLTESRAIFAKLEKLMPMECIKRCLGDRTCLSYAILRKTS